MVKNKVIRGFLIFLLVILVLLGVLVLGLKYVDYKSGNNNEVINDLENESEKNQEIRVNVEKIVSSELNYLLSFDSLGGFTNQSKLQSILRIYGNEFGYKDEITVDDLNKVYSNSSLRNLGIEYEDIYIDEMYQETDKVFYRLDNNIYKKVTENDTTNKLQIAYKYIVNYSKEDSLIVISYKYGFYNILNDSDKINVFSFYEDAIENKNIIKEISIDEYKTDNSDGKNEAINAAMTFDFTNYLDTMKTYTYTFRIDDMDNINLIGYEVK